MKVRSTKDEARQIGEHAFSRTRCWPRVPWSVFLVRPSSFVLCTFSLVFLLGCGSEVKTVPVSGVITFDGNPPPKAGAIYFAPESVEEGMPNRPAFAPFDDQGRFEAQSFREGDGLVPGVYNIHIACWEVEPSMNGPGVSLVPEGFVAENLVVPGDERRVEHNIDVTGAE